AANPHAWPTSAFWATECVPLNGFRSSLPRLGDVREQVVRERIIAVEFFQGRPDAFGLGSPAAGVELGRLFQGQLRCLPALRRLCVFLDFIERRAALAHPFLFPVHALKRGLDVLPDALRVLELTLLAQALAPFEEALGIACPR